MEEPREHYTVVFALIVTEPVSECVCVCGERLDGGVATPLAGFGTIYAKTTLHCSPGSSMVRFQPKIGLLIQSYYYLASTTEPPPGSGALPCVLFGPQSH
jgi:hypothetical protein